MADAEKPFEPKRPLSDKGLKEWIKKTEAGGAQKKLSDSGGLHLLVTIKGGNHWRLAYRWHGQQKTLALGSYPAVSLSDARQKRDEAKATLAKGVDPSTEKKLAKIAAKTANENSFDTIAGEFLDKSKAEKRAHATLTKQTWLLKAARADLGKRPITEITAAEILVTLRKAEAKGNYETARRLRAIIGQVFRYAIATARAVNDPTFGLRGALIAPTVGNRAALVKRDEFADLLRIVWEYEGRNPITRWSLQLMALLYPRPGELRQAHWNEFDLVAGTWTIPLERMKMRKVHKKPLSSKAVQILEQLKEVTGKGSFILPAIHSSKRPMSENTMNTALRRMGIKQDEATAHGFRSSASSLLNESGLWNPDAIEAELAHVGADEVRKAYQRSAFWDERVRMTDWWAGQIEEMLAKKG